MIHNFQGDLIDVPAKTKIAIVRCKAVLPFSELNKIFCEYFDPEKTLIDN